MSRHCTWTRANRSDARCDSPQNVKQALDFVNGVTVGVRACEYAENARKYEILCGPDAKWFQPKETMEAA